ncbi:dienelactone hydrolase family protein [Maricaulis sp.]|uniref:dienelactone hydrolase family protein n=1 Tax=Maricaulis sp. TaxID=1486257 RepID=UPI002B2738C3|nr:dienelactone hydrolase family protein [Maricaulis sp.]
MKKNALIRLVGIAVLALVAGLTGCATVNMTGWSVPRRSLDEQVALLRDHVEIRLPDFADDPVPAVILLHGCGGLREVQEAYSTDLLAAGYAVMLVDSNRARDIGRLGAMTQVCTALRLWGQERAADINAAIALAAQSPAIDSDKLALVGWSHGGWTVLEALDYAAEGRSPPALVADRSDVTATPLAGVRTAIAVYPYCGFPVRADGRDLPSSIPLHAILAERDMVAPPADCQRLFERSAAAGQAIDYETWSGQTHAFDEPNGPPDPRMRYDADAAQRARARILVWLAEAFADQG